MVLALLKEVYYRIDDMCKLCECKQEERANYQHASSYGIFDWNIDTHSVRVFF